MIDKIENLIKDIVKHGKDDKKHKRLMEHYIFFGFDVSNYRERFERMESDLKFKKTLFHNEHRKEFKSDCSCNNKFDIINEEDVKLLEENESRLKKMEKRLKYYKEYLDFLKHEDIKDMHIAKMTS